jgi:predicted ATP-dependent endonuclease of OLD family
MASKLMKLELGNFKCFEQHTIFFCETTIMIGENNAGKSTVVEALRILGLACHRLKSISVYRNIPNWLFDIKHSSVKGIMISSKNIDVELEQVFTGYGNPPASIKAYFDNKLIIEIYIHSEDELFAILYSGRKTINSRVKALELGAPNVFVLPQISPLNRRENYVTEETIQRNKFSKRTSGNFRSILYDNKDTNEYRYFQRVLEETWNGVRIYALEKSDNTMYLQLREREFVTEIYYMGHGVQMWLQTMWFITCAGKDAIIVLDEPDVYMHADLQRKLIRLLKGNYSQTIIATHSVEIMSEVQPNEILIINRKEKESIFAENYPVVQAAISGMGSIHNINLSRMLNNKKYMFVEGKDKDILSIFYDKIYKDNSVPLDHITSVITGGWGSWNLQKINAKKLLAEMRELKIFFLYDRDYHTQEEIGERMDDAQKNNILIHIWERKEIENYLIIPKAIARVIKKRNESLDLEQLSEEIKSLINTICESLKDATLDKIVDSLKHIKIHQHKEYSTIKSEIKPKFEKDWKIYENKISLISGKELISTLSEECKIKFGVSFGIKQIASSINSTEIPIEVKSFLDMIKNS